MPNEVKAEAALTDNLSSITRNIICSGRSERERVNGTTVKSATSFVTNIDRIPDRKVNFTKVFPVSK